MTVEQAIPIAMEYVQKLFAGSNHRLEEVVLRDDGTFGVTVSFYPPGPHGSTVAPFGGAVAGFEALVGRRAAIGIDPHRVYKVVDVTADGQVKAVTMREIVVG